VLHGFCMVGCPSGFTVLGGFWVGLGHVGLLSCMHSGHGSTVELYGSCVEVLATAIDCAELQVCFGSHGPEFVLAEVWFAWCGLTGFGFRVAAGSSSLGWIAAGSAPESDCLGLLRVRLGHGFSGLTGCGFEPLSSAGAPPSSDFQPHLPIMEDRSSLDSRVHRSELLGSAPSRNLSLSPDPPDPLSVSRSHLSNLSHLPLTQSLISVSLSVSPTLGSLTF
jgi:hypothetical protein